VPETVPETQTAASTPAPTSDEGAKHAA
jgi:hypothetical protein